MLDAWPQHLHRHRARPVGAHHLGAVHLRDRGGGDRWPERHERLGEGLLERSGDDALGLGLRERRHLVLQRFEVARERDADHVGPRRQELAELHIGGPERRERAHQAARGGAAGAPFEEASDPQRSAGRHWQRPRIDESEHAFAREHEAGAAEADEVGDRRDHKRQPECSATMPPLNTRCDTRPKPAARIMSAKASGRGKRRIDSTR